MGTQQGTQQEEIIDKLRQIEEQARRALDEPGVLPRERLKLILGMAGHLALQLEIERTDPQRRITDRTEPNMH